ncbi:MAG: potassium channel family protein [Novosphingopyxis baekryungensis]|jgi:voltage-gated potassium channel|uniref:potassium channel family protein n=1 Tax=Novosphingopyxis baekryungensis TaxID=279369 RepID=UPI0003B73779|nr:potassium channel family protein [Novosphingopyxis baekryungensis]MDE0932767.1 potassium channel family protein [Novosphingopyxis baekryungensis]
MAKPQESQARSRQRSRTATLHRKSSVPVWADAIMRTLFVFALIGLAVAVHWFDRTGLQDNYDGDVSFLDVVYFTMISITTTGYGDIAPVTERARMFDALIVTPIRIFVVLIFVGTAYNFVLKRTWDRWRMKILQNNLQNHIVVAGFGVSGQQATKELLARGQDPKTIVVVDRDNDAIAAAESMGCTVLNADATRDETLNDVRIQTACSVIVSAGSDDTSILIVLTVRHLAPDVPISVTVRATDNELLARQAGANNVINPVNFAGLLLAGSCHGEHIADYIADLASVTGRVALAERAISPEEYGIPMTGLKSGVGVRLYRDGQPFGYWQQEAQSLQAGDLVVEIVPGTGTSGDK